MRCLQESENDARTRELALTAMKYSSFGAEHPGDYDVEYNHGLVLQELASYVSHSGRRHALLWEACARHVTLQMLTLYCCEFILLCTYKIPHN